MKNKLFLANKLIKRKGLIKLLKENGISRISLDAIKEIESEVEKDLIKLSNILSQRLLIKGKKTLEKKDILNKSEIKYPEI